MHELVTRAPIDRYLTLNITNFGTEKRCKEEVALMTNCMKPISWEEGLYTVEWHARGCHKRMRCGRLYCAERNGSIK